MKGTKGLMITALMFAAAAGNNPFTFRANRNSCRLTNEESKKRAHRLNPVNLTEHEFVIHGEKIMARNKKTAMKIYANRHKKK